MEYRKTILPVSGIHDLHTAVRSCAATIHLENTVLHRPDWLRRPSYRGYPTSSADIEEPQRKIVQGLSPVRHYKLVGRRHNENELLLFE